MSFQDFLHSPASSGDISFPAVAPVVKPVVVSAGDFFIGKDIRTRPKKFKVGVKHAQWWNVTSEIGVGSTVEYLVTRGVQRPSYMFKGFNVSNEIYGQRVTEAYSKNKVFDDVDYRRNILTVETAVKQTDLIKLMKLVELRRIVECA